MKYVHLNTIINRTSRTQTLLLNACVDLAAELAGGPRFSDHN